MIIITHLAYKRNIFLCFISSNSYRSTDNYYIIDRLGDVLRALEADNFKLVFVQQMGEWVGVVAQKRD
ncbi:hypothetical protein [uncultured Acetobacterium sp.]|uniref:hypothetical protein n=1 Tax=uncultured Acetobacterium sp. TaxID=217139 RepID=UPI0025D0E9EA|nr:hypothetical protein [uncultured Acetobacterium sp.]